MTYTEIKSSLDEIATRSEQNRKRLEQAKALINAADSDLGAMASDYSSIITDLEAGLAAAPSDPAWQAAKAEKDLMVGDFQNLKTRAANLKAAVVE